MERKRSGIEILAIVLALVLVFPYLAYRLLEVNLYGGLAFLIGECFWALWLFRQQKKS